MPLASVVSDGLFFSANCFRKPQTVTFTTGGGYPTATYSGNRYGSDITSGPPNLPPCGYDPAEMQTAYGLNALYKAGLAGQGQTVVIVDAYGSNTIVDDANVFSSLNGLPALTSSNFQIYYPTGPAFCGTDCIKGNWQYETSIDVEWAHAVAPGANIALIETVDNFFTSLNTGILYAIENGLGNVISNSYGAPEVELIGDATDLLVTTSLIEVGAVLGVSTNYSTGDGGDYFAATGSVSAGFPSTIPYATAIGGVSVFLNPNHSIKFQTGWGTNLTEIANVTPNPPVIPPFNEGNVYGATGGPSIFFAKPTYQSKLPGGFRQTPDVSWVADPYTGAEIIVTPTSKPGDPQYVEVFGGTSLACPMFSGLWAIANQAAGAKAPLGSAAPYMYKLTSSAIYDIKAVSSSTNVSGHIYFPPPNPPVYESPAALSAPLEGTTSFVNALYNSPFSTRWFVLSFGTDTSLKTGDGWDNVTGVGSPKAFQFVQEVK